MLRQNWGILTTIVMRIFYLLVLVLILFQSCSTSTDAPMTEQESTQIGDHMMMDGDDDMSGTAAFSGDFVSAAHTTTGKATINEAKTILTFTNFKTSDGPILEVYLATDTSASTYITLGELKGIDGNYEYVLPSNVDYTVYNHVIIWCVDYKINFGYAILK